MITVKLVGKQKLIGQLKSIPPAVYQMLLMKTYKIAVDLQTYIRTQKLSGQVLNVVTGDLRRSINFNVVEAAKKITGRVFSSGDVKYAGIHEFGGTTKPHVITARKAQALAFMYGGKQVFAKSVQHPGSKMPERSFMRSSFSENQMKIASELKEAVVMGIKQATGS